METFIIIWLLCAVAGAMIGRSKGQTGNGFVLGLLFGPFGILFAWLMKGNRQACQACKSSIHAEATICPNCRTPVDEARSKAEIEAIARDNNPLLLGAITAGVLGLIFLVQYIAGMFK